MFKVSIQPQWQLQAPDGDAVAVVAATSRAAAEDAVELVEVEYEPLPAEKQILIIFAGTNGYIDDLPVTALKKFEQELYSFVESRHPELFADILKKRELDNDLRERMANRHFTPAQEPFIHAPKMAGTHVYAKSVDHARD